MLRKQQVIKEYEKVKTVHPSYGEIARKLTVSKSYVYQVIQTYLREKSPHGGQN